MDQACQRLEGGGSDQTIFNELVFLPSRPGFTSPSVTHRIMDGLLFMNSRVFFTTFRRGELFLKRVPVVIYMNYHVDKLERIIAIEQFYMHGDKGPVTALPDANLA